MAKKPTAKAKAIPDERYLIKSTGCEIKLVGYTEGGREFEYLNRSAYQDRNVYGPHRKKPNFVISNDGMQRNFVFKAWVSIQS